MGEFVFPETLRRMRNWNENEKNKKDERVNVNIFGDKSKNNHNNLERRHSEQTSHHLGHVLNQNFSLEMSFSQVVKFKLEYIGIMNKIRINPIGAGAQFSEGYFAMKKRI